MEPSFGDKILVPSDGSESARQAVLYLSRLPALKNREVVLFGLYEGMPDCYYDISQSPAKFFSYAIMRQFAEEERSSLEKELEKSKALLVAEGFDPGRIIVKVQQRSRGIARDILDEAMKGYSLVAAGRKGLNRLESVAFGSVAGKLVEKLHFASLLLVGKGAMPQKCLMAVDGSDAARKAVDFVAGTVAGQGYSSVTLVHVMRRIRAGSNEKFAETGILTRFRETMETSLETMAAQLMGAGFPASAIHRRIVTDRESRAQTILECAESMGCDSLVLGRKGLSDVPEFSLGRVSGKVLQMSRGKAVWLIV